MSWKDQLTLVACLSIPLFGCGKKAETAVKAKPIGMAYISAGEYIMGSDTSYPEEKPQRRVTLPGFWIDTTEVTTKQFAKFVAATSYVTLAEREPSREQYPDADPTLLKPGSAVFTEGKSKTPLACWSYKPGVSWRDGKPDQPVVHVAYEDALAYAKWSNKDLPTEEEWEAAAGSGGKLYPWGDEERPDGKWRANVWQGEFPTKDTGADGFKGLAPTGSFPANKFGLYDMAGNAWEWTKSDGPDGMKVTKGGSFLCARAVCHRYRPSAKQPVTPDTSTEHIGFRCVIRE